LQQKLNNRQMLPFLVFAPKLREDRTRQKEYEFDLLSAVRSRSDDSDLSSATVIRICHSNLLQCCKTVLAAGLCIFACLNRTIMNEQLISITTVLGSLARKSRAERMDRGADRKSVTGDLNRGPAQKTNHRRQDLDRTNRRPDTDRPKQTQHGCGKIN
jgi:hypothetical protein